MTSDATKRYLERISSFSRPDGQPDMPTIYVDNVASKIATLYEKLRQVIDFQEDHLLRRNTIERMLKRRLFLALGEEENIAKPLIFELIRGGYFPNDRIPETKINEVESILRKYFFLKENLPSGLDGSEKHKLADWFDALAASELEEKLSPPKKEDAILDFMLEELLKRFVLPNQNQLDPQERKELIFIACQKSLLRADLSLLNWRLMKLKLPEFSDSPNRELLIELSQKLPLIRKEIEARIQNPLVKKIQKKAYTFAPAFLLLQDVVLANVSEAKNLFENPESLELRIKFAYDRRFAELKQNNRRWGVRWVISILLSKMLFAFLIEVPYDRAHDNFSYLALAINMLFPPFLMFLIVSFGKTPKQENKNLVCWQVMKIVYPKETVELVNVEKPIDRKTFGNILLKLLFTLTSAAVFGGVIFLLLQLSFSWLSIFIFLAFFSLIAFSGIRIEAASKYLRGTEKDGGIFSFIGDIFFLPFRNVGKWLAGQLQRYNLIILFLNLFFEAPLQIFFEFIESWRDFIKRKKEEIEQ